MDNLKKQCYELLISGDRDAILDLLSNDSNDCEFIWLKANAVKTEEEKEKYLHKLANCFEEPYHSLAEEILKREENFSLLLKEPPAYKFWRKERKS